MSNNIHSFRRRPAEGVRTVTPEEFLRVLRDLRPSRRQLDFVDAVDRRLHQERLAAAFQERDAATLRRIALLRGDRP